MCVTSLVLVMLEGGVTPASRDLYNNRTLQDGQIMVKEREEVYTCASRN